MQTQCSISLAPPTAYALVLLYCPWPVAQWVIQLCSSDYTTGQRLVIRAEHIYLYTKATLVCVCVCTSGRWPEAIRPEENKSFFSASVDLNVTTDSPLTRLAGLTLTVWHRTFSDQICHMSGKVRILLTLCPVKSKELMCYCINIQGVSSLHSLTPCACAT